MGFRAIKIDRENDFPVYHTKISYLLPFVHFVLDKVEDDNLKQVLNEQYEKYNNITKRISELYPEYSNNEPHETNALNKALTWYGIEMKTITDKSSSKIAEILLQGTNMGIIEGKNY